MQKYCLHRRDDKGLFQIQALRDIPEHGVKAGAFGGYVHSEKNLSQNGDGWIGEDSYVLDEAFVENGLVQGGSSVVDNAKILGGFIYDSKILGFSVVEGDATVDNSSLSDVEVGSNVQIINSTMKNVFLNPKDFDTQLYLNVFLQVLVPSCIKSKQHWSNVSVSYNNLYIDDNLILRDSTLYGSRFEVLENTHIEYVETEKDWEKATSLLIGKNHPRNKTILKGNSKKEPLKLSGDRLNITWCSISGMISIVGNIIMKYCTITDYASIKMSGSITDAHLSGCSCIDLNVNRQNTINNVQLSGDEVYVNPETN